MQIHGGTIKAGIPGSGDAPFYTRGNAMNDKATWHPNGANPKAAQVGACPAYPPNPNPWASGLLAWQRRHRGPYALASGTLWAPDD